MFHAEPRVLLPQAAISSEPYTLTEYRLLHQITLAISQAPSFEAALAEVLRQVCSATDWAFGEVWLPEQERVQLKHSGIWFATQPQLFSFGQASETYTFRLSEGLPGRVWQHRQAEWLPHLPSLAQYLFKRADVAQAAGLQTGLGVPIEVGDQVFAVLAFFMDQACEQQPSQIALVTAIAQQLGSILRLKQTEAALVESQRQQQQLVNHLPGIVFRAEPGPRWPMVYLSHGCLELTGYPSEALTAGNGELSYTDIIQPSDWSSVQQQIRQALNQRLPYVVEYRICTRAGQKKWLWQKGVGVFDEQGGLLAVEGFIADISDRKAAEQALKARENFLQLILNNIPQQIFWKDRGSVYQGCNLAFAQNMGLSSPQAVVGKTDYELARLQPAEADYYREHDQRVMARAEPDLHVIHEQIYAGDSRHWIDCNKLPIKDDSGAVIGLLCTFDDITEQILEAQAQARREQHLAALVNIQSQLLSLKRRRHDWMTPVLAELGRVSGASRAYYYSLRKGATGLVAQQKAQWNASGIAPTLDHPAFQAIFVETLFPDWIDDLANHGLVNVTRDQFTEAQQQLLCSPPASVQSLLLLPVWVKGDMAGLLGFSNCVSACLWEPAEVALLQVAAATVALAIERQQAEADLRQAETKYRSIFENSVEGIFQSTCQGHYLTVNPMLARLYGYGSPAEMVTEITDIGRQLYVDAGRRQIFVEQIERHGSVLSFESQVRRKDGQIIWISESARALFDAHGQLIGYEGTVEDISQRKQAEAEVQQRDRLLRGVTEASHHLLTTPELEQAIPQVLATLGSAAEVDRVYIFKNHIQPLTGLPVTSLRYEWTEAGISPELGQPSWQNLPLTAHGLRRWHQRFSLRQPVGGKVSEFPQPEQALLQRGNVQSVLRVPIFVDDQLWGHIGFDACRSERQWSANEESILVAIAASLGGAIQRQLTEAQMRHQAFHDPLTGLPNRMLFNQQLPRAIAQARQHQQMLGVFFLDLDRFKTINDTLGHAIGDQLLQQVTQRLMQILRQEDVIARWGGDEFTLLLPALPSAADAANVAQRLLAMLKPAFQLDGQELHISSSIGIALFPQDGDDMTSLLQNADAAMYRAKEQGRNNYQFYTTTLNAQSSQRLILENSLHSALARQEFVIYYQPQVNVETGQVIQVEALLRWQHPKLGLVSPQTFIPLAEETGLIVPIGEWVLRQACKQWQDWHQLGLPDMRVAVNLSARQLQHPDLVTTVTALLQESQLPPAILELEITETAAMRDVDATIETLQALRSLGVRISMDDFGTGYSSLSYLKKFPLHGLKIDRAFIHEVAHNEADRAMVTAIIAMAQGLRLNVVAEGVETLAQLEGLRVMGCTDMQGFLFSQPLPAAQVNAYLQAVTANPGCFAK